MLENGREDPLRQVVTFEELAEIEDRRRRANGVAVATRRLIVRLPPVGTVLLWKSIGGIVMSDPKRRGMWMCPQRRSWTQFRSGGARSADPRR